MDINSLQFANPQYPHHPLCIIDFDSDPSCEDLASLDLLARKTQLCLIREGKIVIFRDRDNEEAKENTFFFTGVAFQGGRLIFGEKDNPDPQRLSGNYGEWSAVIVSPQEIQLKADYFGFGKWYYYCNKSILVASTSYHLLLLALISCGVELEMDINRSLVNLYSIGWGFALGQQFSRRMDVSKTFMKMADEEIVYNRKERRISLIKTELRELLEERRLWDEADYEKYMRIARKEIYSNLRAVFANPRFERVIVDLSGGFDSRVVYSAMTCLPQYHRKKAAVYIRKSHLPDDEQIAHSVNNIYGFENSRHFEVDLDSAVVSTRNGYSHNLYNLSLELGGYTNLEIMRKYNANSSHIKIMGGGGDITFGFNRVYGWYKDWYSRESQEDLLNHIALSEAGPLGGRCRSVIRGTVELLGETINELPDHLHLFQKLQIFYLMFRNNCHFPAFRYADNLLTINVLHSKFALIAKFMYWSRFKPDEIPPEKVSIDMISLFNPLLSIIPFAIENRPFMPKDEELMSPVYLKIETNPTIQPTIDFSSRPTGPTYSANVLKFTRNLDNSRHLLDFIASYSTEYEEVVNELRALIDKQQNSSSESISFKVINKIMHVAHEINLCQQSVSLARALEGRESLDYQE